MTAHALKCAGCPSAWVLRCCCAPLALDNLKGEGQVLAWILEGCGSMLCQLTNLQSKPCQVRPLPLMSHAQAAHLALTMDTLHSS